MVMVKVNMVMVNMVTRNKVMVNMVTRSKVMVNMVTRNMMITDKDIGADDGPTRARVKVEHVQAAGGTKQGKLVFWEMMITMVTLVVMVVRVRVFSWLKYHQNIIDNT